MSATLIDAVRELLRTRSLGSYLVDAEQGITLEQWVESAAAALERMGALCVWTPMEADSVQDWETACGRAWSFTEDGPAENRMDFCMGCGRRVSAPAPAGTEEVRDDE